MIVHGYGEVPVAQMDTYATSAAGLLIGQNLPDSAERDFEAEPQVAWGSPGETPDNQEGHDTWYIAGHSDGTGEVITWGARQPFTEGYRRNFVTDAWIIYDADDPTVDHAALLAALAEVHGTDAPPAPQPSPGPANDPTPPPLPQPPEPLPESHRGWWASVEAWITEHLHPREGGE